MNPEGPAQQAATAAEVCSLFAPSPPALKLLRPGEPPAPYFQRLVDEGLFSDAVQFVAHLLPKRAAVWWACKCVWLTARPKAPAPDEAALQAAVRWVLDPSEDNRRAAEKAGRAAGMQSPAGCLAMAVFWSNGSMSRPDLPAVSPPPHLTARTLGAAVQMAATTARKPPDIRNRYRKFLALAVEVDNNWNGS